MIYVRKRQIKVVMVQAMIVVSETKRNAIKKALY